MQKSRADETMSELKAGESGATDATRGGRVGNSMSMARGMVADTIVAVGDTMSTMIHTAGDVGGEAIHTVGGLGRAAVDEAGGLLTGIAGGLRNTMNALFVRASAPSDASSNTAASREHGSKES